MEAGAVRSGYSIGEQGLGAKLGDLALLAVHGVLGKHECAGHDLLGCLVRTGRHVAALLADGREHFVGDPTLERLRLGLAGLEHELVEAGLGDAQNCLIAARGLR